MGNKCQCLCMGSTDNNGFKIKSSKKSNSKRKAKEPMLPEDLHASGVQVNKAGSSVSCTQRPNTLEVHSVIDESSSQAASSKFPSFSLHGIQKSSFTPASGDSTPMQFNKCMTLPHANYLSKLEELFNHYCDKELQEILADGVEQFCLDLEVDPTEFVVLALAWKFKASTMCRFTKQEFIEGFISTRCDSIPSLKDSLKLIESEALENFKDMYRFTFQFALEADQGQRSLPCDVAVAMWNIVFSKKIPPLLASWIEYITISNVKGISRDTWNMFLYLVESLNEDLSNYNDNEAWPSLFDDFVEYKREQLKENQQMSEKVTAEDNLETAQASRSDEAPSSVSVVSQTTQQQQTQSSSETTPLSLDQTSPVKKHSSVEVPGMIVSSSESIPDMRASLTVQTADAETNFTDASDVALCRVPSSPGEILSHLHSE